MTRLNAVYTPGPRNVNHLDAPYALLVKAFGREGTVDPRDEYKCEATWFVQTTHGEVQVYDYKVGKAYNGPKGLARKDIRDWHVQGEPEAIGDMLDMVKKAAAK